MVQGSGLKILNSVVFLLSAICLVSAQIDECPPENCTDLRCELTHSEKAIDVVFLIDGSESISIENFTTSLEWALAILDEFKPQNRTQGLKVFMVQYSKDAKLEIEKEIVDSSAEIRSDVFDIEQMVSGTRTYEALTFVNNDVFPRTRNNAFKILITMTDGQPTDSRKPEEIEKARNNFNVMVAVSVGAEINDAIQDFAFGVEPIYVTGFGSLLTTTGIFNIIVNSTYIDCVELRAWCGARTKSTLTVSYCVCNPSSNVNASLFRNYELEISPSGTGTNPITKAIGETSATFDGLDPNTEYAMTVNALLSKSSVQALPATVNCSTKGYIIINPTCGNSFETSLEISFSLDLRGISDISDLVEEFRIEISPPGTNQNTITKTPDDARTAKFTGLSKGTVYTVTITAVTFEGADVEVEAAYINCSTIVCPDECRPLPTKLVFLIDGSESILPSEFSNSLQWVLETIDKFKAKDSRELRVTAVQYSENAATEIDNKIIQSSAEEIRNDIESIQQKREGTKPYTGLHYINNNVNLDNSFYNVLITLSDGRSRNEVRDQTVIDRAVNNYDVMLAVGLGTNPDMATLADFVDESEPFRITDTATMNSYIDNITEIAHEDCIKFDAECDCDETSTMVLVRYSAELFGNITEERELITNYLVTITPDGATTEVPLGSLSTSFSDGLSPYTRYLLKVDGQRIADKCGVVIPKSVNCTTRAVIEPTMTCGASTDTILGVSYDPGSSGFGGDFSFIQGFVVEISLGGTTQNSLQKRVTDRTASFTGLSPSTQYTITIYPIKSSGVCAVNSSHSVDCSTKATTEVDVACNTSTRDSVTVDYSGDTTHPDGIRSRIQTYRLTLSPGEIVVERGVDEEQQYTFNGLSPSTTYTITLTAVVADGVDDVIVPSSVSCTTKGLILIDVRCKNETDHTLTVEYSINPDMPGVIEFYTINISPPGKEQNEYIHRNNEGIVLFSGLSPSTTYQITVAATTVIGADYEVEPDSVNCITKEEVCRHRKIDLVFLIDGSESIDQENFKEGLDWTSQTADRFNQDRTETLRVVAVQYSDISQQEFDRNSLLPTDTISNNVANINQIRSSTRTYSGLQFITSDVSPNARNGSCEILITMSDGDSTEPRDQSAIDSVIQHYDVIIAVGYTEPIMHEAQLQDLSTVGKPITIQNSASISNIVTEVIENCCRKETMLRVDLVVSCKATTNSIIVNYHPIPFTTGTNGALIQTYQVKIAAKGEEFPMINGVTETTALFTGLYSDTSYVVEVTGTIVDGATVEVMPTYLSCMTKNPCASSPCQNGATCEVEERSDYKCNCLSGWTGTNCVTALVTPVVECVFTTDTTIVVGFSVLPSERGYDSSLISNYSVEISSVGAGSNSLTKAVGDMTATFSQLSQSTEYTVVVNVMKTEGANVEVVAGSATCRTKTFIRPIVTCPSRTNDSITVSYSTDVTDLSIIQGFNIGNGMSVISTSAAEDTALLSGLIECTEYTITVDVDVNPSRTDDVILESGSAICRTGDGDRPPTYSIVNTDSNEVVINIDAISCATSYTIIYTRFDCDTSATEARTITDVTYIIPRMNDTERFSITVYAHYEMSGLSEGTTRNVSALSDDDCVCTSNPADPSGRTQDECLAPIIALAVLLGVAVVIAILLAIALIRKGR